MGIIPNAQPAVAQSQGTGKVNASSPTPPRSPRQERGQRPASTMGGQATYPPYPHIGVGSAGSKGILHMPRTTEGNPGPRRRGQVPEKFWIWGHICWSGGTPGSLFRD